MGFGYRRGPIGNTATAPLQVSDCQFRQASGRRPVVRCIHEQEAAGSAARVKAQPTRPKLVVATPPHAFVSVRRRV